MPVIAVSHLQNTRKKKLIFKNQKGVENLSTVKKVVVDVAVTAVIFSNEWNVNKIVSASKIRFTAQYSKALNNNYKEFINVSELKWSIYFFFWLSCRSIEEMLPSLNRIHRDTNTFSLFTWIVSQKHYTNTGTHSLSLSLHRRNKSLPFSLVFFAFVSTKRSQIQNEFEAITTEAK